MTSGFGAAGSPSGVRRRKISCRGFTLIELMIGLVLVAVLLGIAVPTFRSFILGQRLRATSTDLQIALITARSEAVKRNRAVTLNPSDDGWGAGWTIPSPNSGEPDILNHVQTGDATITGPDEVAFTPNGRVATTDVEFEIDVGPDTSGDMSCLTLGLDGRASSVKGACPP